MTIIYSNQGKNKENYGSTGVQRDVRGEVST